MIEICIIERLIEWLNYWMVEWSHRVVRWVIIWFRDWMIIWLDQNEWLILNNWMIERLNYLLIERLNHCVYEWSNGWMIEQLGEIEINEGSWTAILAVSSCPQQNRKSSAGGGCLDIHPRMRVDIGDCVAFLDIDLWERRKGILKRFTIVYVNRL